MPHLAKVVGGVVDQVIVAHDTYIVAGREVSAEEWAAKVYGGEWIRTSYNTLGGVHRAGGEPLRKNFAARGYIYDRVRDAFIPPKPFDSWRLNEQAALWEAPVAKPDDGREYEWDDARQQWRRV